MIGMRDSEKALIHILETVPELTPASVKDNHGSILVIGTAERISAYEAYYSPYHNEKIGFFDIDQENGQFDAVYVIGKKQKQESAYFLAKALKLAKNNAPVVMVLENDWGGKNLEKLYKSACLETQSESKHKSRIVWTRTPQTADQSRIDEWIRSGAKARRADEQWTQPGIFSWENLDKGTQALQEVFKKEWRGEFRGKGADFGCGCGDLAKFMLESCYKIKKFHLLDIDKRAVDCAKQNLERKFGEIIEPHWIDITKGSLPQKLDFIVMNPPFHTGKDQLASLGKAFILQASKSLDRGGLCLIVANVHLPYEDTIRDLFYSFEIIEIKSGFKIILARK